MAPELLRINLDPSSVLYLRKIAVRRRPIRNAIPLPGFTWQAERNRLRDVTDREVGKNMMRAVAYSWRATLRDGDAAFVSLIKFTVTPDRFHFRMDCPHQKVLDPLGDKAAREALASVDVRHKYALMDELCPIAFVWNHAAREVLITNEFHISNPAQFLAIDRVGTTSGLLNFIGAFNIMQMQDRYDELKTIMPRLLKEAMAARADEWLRWLNHLIDERTLLEPKRLYVDKDNPETYFYDYSAKPV